MTKRFTFTILVVILSVVGFSRVWAQDEAPTDATCRAAAADESYNEDQVLFEYEAEFVKGVNGGDGVIALAKTWGAANASSGKLSWSKSPELPHSWYFDDHVHSGDKRYDDVIEFTAYGYFKGDPVIGAPQVFDLSGDKTPGISREYYTPGGALVETVEEKITLSESFSQSYTQESSFDVSKSVSASVTAGFEAGTAGVKVSGSATVEGGYSVSSSKAFGNTNESSTEKTIEETVSDELDIPEGDGKLLLTIDILKKRVITPVLENGYIDFSGKLILYKWAGRTTSEHWLSNSIALQDDHAVIEFANVSHLLEIIKGQHERSYPHMGGYYAWLQSEANKHDAHWSITGALAFISWLENPENRHVCLRRSLVREYEKAGEVRFVREAA